MTIWKACIETKPNNIDDLVITIAEESLTFEKAITTCKTISEHKKENKKVVLCFKRQSGTSDNLNLVFMSMLSNGYFSIIEVDDLSDIDADYAESVIDYDMDIDELKATLSEGLGNLAAQLKTDPSNPMNGLITNLVNTTIESGSKAQTMPSAADTEQLQTELSTQRGLVASLQNQLASSKTNVQNLNNCIEEQATQIKRLNAEKDEIAEKLTITEDKLSSFNNGLDGINVGTAYVEFNLDKYKTQMLTRHHINLDVDQVIYFKELTPCAYINSFMINFIQYIKIHRKKSVICLIYDRAEFTRLRYGNLPILNASNFVPDNTIKINNTDNKNSNSIFVVQDAAQQILEEAVKTYDLVLVYDRLGMNTDIISGRQVHKVMVVNSNKELLEVQKATKAPLESFITSFGVNKQTISVRFIKEYKQNMSSGKFMSYVNMCCTANDNTLLFDQFLYVNKVNFTKIEATQYSV